MRVTELICEKLDNPIIFIVKEQKTMDFHLSKEHLLVRKMYREFAENEVKPLAEELDEEERFPMETVEKMAKLGMMGIYRSSTAAPAAMFSVMPCAWRSSLRFAAPPLLSFPPTPPSAALPFSRTAPRSRR